MVFVVRIFGGVALAGIVSASLVQVIGAEMDFGPCDPIPEDGAPVVLAQDPAPEEAPGVESCP